MKRGVKVFASLAVLAAGLALGFAGGRGVRGQGTPDPGKKLKVVGFAQEGAESDWRKANTLSIQDEAKKRGIDLKFSDAQEKQENQIKAIRSFINQGVDVIVFAPIVKTGWDDVLKEARAAQIPVIIEDRMASASPDLYAAYVGSDFQEEGQRAGDWLAKATAGKATIAVIEGVQGSDAADGRKKGFEAEIRKYPDMKIIVSKPGDFPRDKGKEVAQAILKSPDGAKITAMFIHNDDMALGAIQAIKEAGKKPGKDIIIVSVDGIKGAFEAMLAGDLNCSVECNPLLGPQVFDLAEKVYRGEKVPKITHSNESVYDAKNVTAGIVAGRKY
jgi:simple sugar transport system substrate-binding protein